MSDKMHRDTEESLTEVSNRLEAVVKVKSGYTKGDANLNIRDLFTDYNCSFYLTIRVAIPNEKDSVTTSTLKDAFSFSPLLRSNVRMTQILKSTCNVRLLATRCESAIKVHCTSETHSNRSKP